MATAKKRSKLLARTVIASLAAALAFAALASLPSAAAASPATFHVTLATANADMSVMGMAFYPAALTVHAGDSVVFTNVLPEPHTVTFGLTGPAANPQAFFKPQNLSGPGTGTYTGTGILNSGWLFPGGPFGNAVTITIAVGPGTYTFRCALHPAMVGTINVIPDSQALPYTDAQEQLFARSAMTQDLAHGTYYEVHSALAAAKAADIGGTGIEIAIGGGNGVTSVMRFYSDNLTIHVGDKVHFVNQDPYTPHTVTFGAEPPGAPFSLHNPYGNPNAYDGTYPLNSGFLQPFLPWGMEFNVTFTAAGTYRYICGLHDTMGMVGTITVLP